MVVFCGFCFLYRLQRRKEERNASGLVSNWITVNRIQQRREKTDVLMVTEMRWNKRRQPEQGRKGTLLKWLCFDGALFWSFRAACIPLYAK